MMCLAKCLCASDIKTGVKVAHVTFFGQRLSRQYVVEINGLYVSRDKWVFLISILNDPS